MKSSNGKYTKAIKNNGLLEYSQNKDATMGAVSNHEGSWGKRAERMLHTVARKVAPVVSKNIEKEDLMFLKSNKKYLAQKFDKTDIENEPQVGCHAQLGHPLVESSFILKLLRLKALVRPISLVSLVM